MSEALSWVAFSASMSGADLNSNLRSKPPADRADAEAKLTHAINRLAELGFGGEIAMRGKHVDHFDCDANKVDTQSIVALKLADYKLFDPCNDCLHRGEGLLWVGVQDGKGEMLALKASEDYFCFVTVKRSDLLLHFPTEKAKSRNAAKSSMAAERECAQWLQEAFAADPEGRRVKQSFECEALWELWKGRLSQRGFDRAWNNVAPSAGRNLPGRKSKQ